MPGAWLQGQAPAGLPSFLGQPGSERAWLVPHLSSKKAAGCISTNFSCFIFIKMALAAGARSWRGSAPASSPSCLCTGVPAPKAPGAFLLGTEGPGFGGTEGRTFPSLGCPELLTLLLHRLGIIHDLFAVTGAFALCPSFAVEPLCVAGSWDRW